MVTDIKALVAEVVNSEAKFVDEDVTPTLREASLAYLVSYEGNFNYLVDLKRRDPSKLSVGQVRGILNCIRAEVLRGAKAQDDGQVAPAVVSGRYAVLMADKLRFFRVNAPTEGKWVGYTFITEEFGGGRKFQIRDRVQRMDILQAISDDPEALARYGKELGVCGVCGKALTDEESRMLGIGPVCRAKLNA